MNLCLTVESCALCSTDECVVDLTWTDLVDATSSSNSSSVIKPWHERQDLTNYVESDPDDEQLLLRVPFTANVKLRSISILGEGGDQAPKQLKVYINRPELDFSDVLDDATEPVQTLDLVQSREVVDYSVRPAKFSNIQHLTLFFSQNFADDSESQTRIYYFCSRESRRARSSTASRASSMKLRPTQPVSPMLGCTTGDTIC